MRPGITCKTTEKLIYELPDFVILNTIPDAIVSPFERNTNLPNCLLSSYFSIHIGCRNFIRITPDSFLPIRLGRLRFFLTIASLPSIKDASCCLFLLLPL